MSQRTSGTVAKRRRAAEAPAPHAPPDLPLWRRRQRLRRSLITLAVVLGLPVLIWLDHRGYLLHGGDDWIRYHQRAADVAYVFDGDTLAVGIPDRDQRTTRVRLWGIDTAERGRDGGPDEPWSQEATDFVHTLTQGRQVTLVLQTHQTRDRYQRVLAYITLEDGTDLAERLLAAGLARAETRFGHQRMDRYIKLERQAKIDRIGLWSD